MSNEVPNPEFIQYVLASGAAASISAEYLWETDHGLLILKPGYHSPQGYQVYSYYYSVVDGNTLILRENQSSIYYGYYSNITSYFHRQ